MLHYNILQDGPGLGVPGASRVMKWFRIRTRLGARLSLLAMALQLALTFGHVHALASHHAGHDHDAPSSGWTLETSDAHAEPDADHGHGPICAQCFVIAQANMSVAGAAPTLSPPIARDHAAAAFPATAAAPGASTAAFHPRGPPQV